MGTADELTEGTRPVRSTGPKRYYCFGRVKRVALDATVEDVRIDHHSYPFRAALHGASASFVWDEQGE